MVITKHSFADMEYSHSRPFYGKEILPDLEQERIQKILNKYRSEAVTPELKKKIHDELMREKEKGNISIPFKVVLRHGLTGTHRPYIEVLLETKV